MNHWLAWKQSNLYRNPFGELTRRQRAELAVVDLERLLSLVRRRHTALQFIGDCGCGKTTRMLALASRLADATYTYIPEDQPCPVIADGQVVLIDEAQRLPRAAERQIFASGVPLVLATHRSLARPLRRHGYAVHTERIGPANTPELVERVLNRRIEAARWGSGPVPQVPAGFARQMVARFGTNIRAIEHYLYERTQAQINDDGQVRFDD